MKKTSRILAFVITACLLLGVLAVSAFALSTRLDFGFDGVYADTKHDFESYSAGSTYFDSSSTIKPAGGNIWPNSTFNNDTSIVVKQETVNGVSNNYVEIKANDGCTTMSGSEGSACWTFNKSRTIKDSSYDREYLVVEFDIRASQYVTTDANGVHHLYDSLDEITDETELASAKLSYPEGLYFYTPVSGKYADGTSKTIQRFFYIVSVNNEWYLTTNNASSVEPSYNVNEACKLPGDIGEWNHITFVQRFTGRSGYCADGITVYAYINGNYAGKASSSGYNNSIKSSISYTMRMHILKSVVQVSEPSYCFDLDNIAANLYENYYEPTVENSFTEAFRGTVDTTKSLVEYGDLVYNYDYVSPHGTSYALKWVDLNGRILGGERISIGNTPTLDANRLLYGDFSGVSGDYSKIEAWEWNVSEDPSVFTPVTALTGEMIGVLKAREGDKTLTVRPAVVDVSCVDGLGNVLASDKYFAGNEVSRLDAESNGWYSISYQMLSNRTEGAAADSFITVGGVENVFLADVENADAVASISGIKYNMSLLTNYYMNLYVPIDAPEGITPLGFYAEEALINKYSDSSRKVSIGGEIYEENSFAIRNSDIDLNVPRYYGFEAVIGGTTYTFAYEINADLIGYVRGVLEVYSCGSCEASLAVNLLGYAYEAYLLDGGEEHISAKLTLEEHKDCGCVVSGNVDGEYKGNISTLSGYLYGAAYNITSAEPSLILYLLEDKADSVTKITVGYEGLEGEVNVEISALAKTTLNGKSVIPYSYSRISASDVKEVMTVTVYGEDDTILAEGTYSLTNYAFNNNIAVANALFAFSKSAAAYKKSVLGSSESPVIMEGIEVEKTSSLRPSTTLAGGDKITYTIKITNNNDEALNVPVSDMIPANTYYVSGGADVNGFKLNWTVNVGAGETKTLSYVVAVDKNKALLGKDIILTAPNANAGGNIAECNDENYIARTINDVDAFYMKAGIEAMSYSDEYVQIVLGSTAAQEAAKPSPLAIIKYIYYVAFTKTFTIDTDGTVADVISAIFEASATEEGIGYRAKVVPTLWGGSSVTSVLSGIKGESAAIEYEDFIIGDILFVKDSDGARVYVFDGDKLISFTNGYESADTETVIAATNSANYYAVLRPTMTMSSLVLSDPDYEAPELTPEQQALVGTAYQYILRGTRLQYDDGTLASNSEYRWQIGKYQPEDYTEQNWRYINCAGFTYDIYYTTLGYDLGNLYTTASLMRYFTNGGAEKDSYPFYYEWNAEVSADPEKRAEVEARFFDTLEVGDLVVITRGTSTGGYGHVMLYVGNGMLAHSTGSTRSGDTENYEPTIRYMNAWSYLFDPTASNYLFIDTPGEKTVYQTCIVRPLADFKGEIPENSQNRLDNLLGIISEKLSSHPEGVTVNKGEEITFTYKIKNTNNSSSIIFCI